MSSWEAAELGFSAYEKMPKKFSDFLIGEVAAQVAQKTEQSIWNGANATAGEFDGFVTLFKADSDVSDISGTTVTSANVIAEMGKVIDACPSALYGIKFRSLDVTSKNNIDRILKFRSLDMATSRNNISSKTFKFRSFDTTTNKNNIDRILQISQYNHQQKHLQKKYFNADLLIQTPATTSAEEITER